MNSFKALNTKKYQKSGPVLTPDFLYWKRLGVPTLIKEFGAIDYIDFSPVEPYYFAVTCSVRVQIYNPLSKLVVKNLSRFQESAYGGTFRRDGRLLIAGDEEGFVKLFDVTSKNVLRLFRGHNSAVHRTYFTTDLLHVASFSDDKTVKLWDIASEKSIQTYSNLHTDYIRAGAVNPVSDNIILSGSYDNTIRMYDTRSEHCITTMHHGNPIESLLFLPTGGIFLSAGGTEIKVWDLFAGGKLLAKLSQHHKTVTTLRLASNGKRILSGGLDRHVKIYDVATYQTVHNLDYSNSILSLGIAPNDQTLVTGMVDGLVSIQNMETDSQQQQQLDKDANKKRYLITFDNEIDDYSKKVEAKHDHYLRKYEYSKALDAGLKPYVVNKTPHVTVSIMQELLRRKGLHRALAGRSQDSIATIIRFIMRYIGEHRFMRVLIEVGNTLLDVYEVTFHNFTGELGKLFVDLSKALRKEVDLTYDLLELQGVFELLIAAASVTDDTDETVNFFEDKSNVQQSEKAKEPSIVVIN